MDVGKHFLTVDHSEMRKNKFLLSATLLAFSLPTLVGCDKVKTVVGNFRKAEKSKSSDSVVAANYSPDQIAVVTKPGYADFISRKNALVIVDFHAEWCPPCKKLGPVLARATEAHPGVVYLGKVNVDQAPDLAKENGVSSIPDVRIFKDGKEMDRFVGYPGEQSVLAKIAKLSEGIHPPTPAEVAADVAAETAPEEPKMKPFDKDWLPPGITRK